MMRCPTIAAVLWVAVLLPCAALARDATPPGSFLKYRAATVRELVNQVSSDANVRTRYAQHFGVPAAKVASMLGDGLKLVSLDRPAKVRTWYVRKGGGLSAKTKLLPRGTLVFVGSDGKPLLAWSCGNPLRAELPQAIAGKPEAKKPVGTATQQAASPITEALTATDELPVETKVLAQPVEAVGTEPVASLPEVVLPADEPVIIAQALPAVPLAAAIAPAVNVSGIAAVSALVGGLAFAVSSKSNPTPPPQVPEPTGIAVMASGILMGLSAARAKRSHRR